MRPSPHAEKFGELLLSKFASEANSGSFREVHLFRALRKAILATSPYFPVEEFHGARSQVIFPARPPWTKSVARCELADLCVVWFRRSPLPSARITFMQAKRSTSLHNLCNGAGGSISDRFDGDSTQWYLLHNRPAVLGRFQTFQPPTNLLKDAVLPSVASYCVFHEVRPHEYSFFYVSADVVTASIPSSPGHVHLSATAPAMSVMNGGLEEQKWACCPLIFGQALYSGKIGTPIDHQSVTSRDDGDFRTSVRRWLASVLTTAVQQRQVGPVIQAFVGMFDMVLPEEPTTAPARSIVFIQGDDEPGRE